MEISRETLKQRGLRLKQLRLMAGLTQHLVESKYGHKINTQNLWENGRKYGLGEKAANKLITMYQQEGIICNSNWLLTGDGEEPILAERSAEPVDQQFLEDDTNNALRELTQFVAEHPGTIHCQINDCTMQPAYLIGDMVAGIQLENDELKFAEGHDCIVQLKNGELLVRYIPQVNNDSTCTLQCYDINATDKPFLYDVAILSAAPICWQRRPMQWLADMLANKSLK